MRRALVPWIVASALVVLGVAFAVRPSDEAAVPDLAADKATTPTPTAIESLDDGASKAEVERTVARATPDTPTVPAEREVPGALRVRVVADEDGRPLAGVLVWTGSRKQDRATPATRTDADGVVSWAPVGSGRYAIQAELAERRSARVDARVPKSGGTAEVEVRLVANALDGEYRVRLVDASGASTAASLGLDPHLAANLALGLSSTCARPGDAFDPRDGPTFRASQLGSGASALAWKLELRDRDARACAHLLLGDAVLAAQPLPPRGGEVVMHVDRAEVERALTPLVVRVVSREGRAALAGASLRVTRDHRVHGDARTDAAGVVRFDRAGAGEVDVTVIADGYATATARARRPFTDELVLELTVGHPVEGTAFDDGRPFAGANVRAFAAADLGRDARALDVVVADASGRFAFRALPGSEVVVCLDVPDSGPRWRVPERAALAPACAYVAHVGGAHGVVLGRPAGRAVTGSPATR